FQLERPPVQAPAAEDMEAIRQQQIAQTLTPEQEAARYGPPPPAQPEIITPELGSPFQPPEETQPKIVSAAVMDDKGKIYTGRTHGEAMNATRATNIPDELADGFVTDTGQYLTGEQANLMGKGEPGVLDATELERINRKGEPYAAQPPQLQPQLDIPDDPFVSSIANRYVADRVAAGELGEIAPGQGYST